MNPTNQRSGEEYAREAARLLGYPNAESIDNPGDIDRMARVAAALISEYGEGYKAGWVDAKRALDRALDNVKHTPCP